MSLLNVTLEAVPSVDCRELEVRTARGTSTADLWLPPDAGSRVPVLLLGHGGGFPHPGRQMPRLRKLAQRLAHQAGAAVLVIDGPAHGARSPELGDPLASSRRARQVLLDPELPVWFTEEWKAALQAARGVSGVDASNAGYIGFSMGTLLGVSVVAAIPEIRAAVFGLGGVPRLGGVGELARSMGAPDEVVQMVNEEDDAEIRGRVLLEDAARISGREVLLVNTTEDEVFPVPGILQFYEALASPARIALFRGGHLALPDEAIDLAVWFLRRCLAGESPDRTPSGAW